MKDQIWQTKLSPKQIEVLEEIADYQARNCCSATISELAKQLGCARTTVHEHIAGLRKKGFIEAGRNKARSLTLTSCAYQLLDEIQRARAEDHFDGQSNDGIELLGRVAAGSPIEAVEDCQMLSLTEQFASGSGDTFALEVCGDSMIGDDIQNGDWVICKKAQTAKNGQLAIVIVADDTATLKRFYKEKDRARLQPANKNYDPIYTSDCRIEGVVVGLVRKF